MKMRHIRYFVAVAEELSFTRAAQRLNTAQPSLSQQIRQLEDRVGVQLLERNQRSVRLTVAGEVLLKEARGILRQTQRAVERARAAGAKATPIRLGVIPAAEMGILPKVIGRFWEYDASTEIIITSRPPSRLLGDLMSGQIDAAFSRFRDADERQLRADGFEVLTVEHHRLIAAVPSDHPLARNEGISINDLQGVDVIAIDPIEAPELHRFINSALTNHGVDVNFVQSGENVLSTLNMVEMGLGIAILPDYITSFDRPKLGYHCIGGMNEQLALHFAVRSATEEGLRALYECVASLAGPSASTSELG